MKTRLLTAFLLVVALAVAVPASAQTRGGTEVGRSAPRGVVAPRTVSPRFVSPGIVRTVPFRPFFYPYRPGISLGFYAGFPGFYGYPYGYPYGYYGYGYPYGLYPGYYGGYGYLGVVPGQAYGGVRIKGAPRDAQVYVDGYYAGIVDDFDGTFQHMNLEPGAHRVEIRTQNAPPLTFDVDVRPGETITYRAGK
jgi:hypothetical protein